MSVWKAVVIEDQTLFRELLAKTLQADPRYEFAGQAGDGCDGLALCREMRPDLVILDIQLPQADGFAVADGLREELPDARILALTSLDDPHTISRVLEFGFSGYVGKSQPLSVLQAAMLAVAEGGVYFSPEFEAARLRMAADPNAFVKILSRREQEILKLIAAGRSSAQAAAKLGLSPRTAANHRYNIMRKLDIHNAADLVAFAIRNGLRATG